SQILLLSLQKKNSMAAIELKIEIPNASKYDMDLLKRQLTDFARILITTSNLEGRTKKQPVAEDPFVCFSGDWGGDKSAHEISEDLRSSRSFTRTVETW
ncbi:MAG: hypothetical protein Q4D56_13330, partial [Bacteroides sp.]|nr:hypothetical protein [Bacteroides sp.]